LIPYLDLLDNALLPQVAIRIPDARSRATALLEQLGLGDRLHHRPAEVSIGERQRAALARALLKCPRLILADEPTGNLDPANAAQVLDTLSRYHVAGGTVLLVTHAPAAALQAGRVVYLEAGRVCPGPANGAAAPAPAL
jgi:putative ABC transport system ATP-binding protein